MVKANIPAGYITIILIALVSFSCSSSRYQQGFSYKPSYAAPDISSGEQQPEKESATVVSTVETKTQNGSITEHIVEHNSLTIAEPTGSSPNQQEVLASIVGKEYSENASSAQPLNTREKLHKIAEAYAETQNKTLTSKQLRKLDRYAAKMEKKQQRRAQDVNWGPESNLEWFVLLGAGVALVVGILGIGFGWFVFLGLALVYLYFKLLKNN